MRTIRRLYFYTVALISLEVVVWGLIGLLRSIFSSRLVNTADVLAQALALVLVGVPIFLFHWLWTQRAALNDEEERTASLRAIFFYAVLIGTLVPVVQNLLAFVNRVVLGVSDIAVSRALVGGSQTWQDNLIAIFINGVVGFYFYRTLRAEWKFLPEVENFADVRRLYRYLWLLYGLLIVVYGAQQIIRFIFYIPVPTYLLGEVGREMFVNGLTLLLIGTPLWVYVWRICQDALSASAERDSKSASGRTLPALAGRGNQRFVGGRYPAGRGSTLGLWRSDARLRVHPADRRTDFAGCATGRGVGLLRRLVEPSNPV